MPTPSLKYQIALWVQTTLRGLTGAPAADHVDIREDDTLKGLEIDDLPRWVITMGDEDPLWDTTAGDTSGNGDTAKHQFIGVSMYYDYDGDLTDRLSSTPAIVKDAMRSLNVRPPIVGVWRSDLVRQTAWERNTFQQGSEVTRFLMVYSTVESRNG